MINQEALDAKISESGSAKDLVTGLQAFLQDLKDNPPTADAGATKADVQALQTTLDEILAAVKAAKEEVPDPAELPEGPEPEPAPEM